MRATLHEETRRDKDEEFAMRFNAKMRWFSKKSFAISLTCLKRQLYRMRYLSFGIDEHFDFSIQSRIFPTIRGYLLFHEALKCFDKNVSRYYEFYSQLSFSFGKCALIHIHTHTHTNRCTVL